ncbi:unnamed protein product [Cunninghamella echinulata]
MTNHRHHYHHHHNAIYQERDLPLCWSICLGMLSEHLLEIGQQHYTQWINEIRFVQQQQTIPFKVATETLKVVYSDLQTEQVYAILSRVCLQLESFINFIQDQLEQEN